MSEEQGAAEDVAKGVDYAEFEFGKECRGEGGHVYVGDV